MSIKNPLTPAGIEPATFRFVAQHFNKVFQVRGRISGYEFTPFKFRNRFRLTAKQLKRDRCVGSDVVDKFRKVKPAVT